MSGGLLVYLDILIGFSLVMLLASSMVTVVVQWFLNVINYRARVLRDGLRRLLIQAGVSSDGSMAAKIAGSVLCHPLVAGRSWLGNERQGAVIQREELVRILLMLALDEKAAKAPERKALRKALDLQESDIATPKAWLDAIEQRSVQLEVESPGEARHVLQARAIVERVSAPVMMRLMSWFDETSDRMTQNFSQRTRAITIGAALLVALLLPLDALDLLRRLSIDEALRSRLVEAAERLEKASSAMATPPGEAPSAGGQAAKPSAEPAQLGSQVTRLRTELEELEIVPRGGLWTFWQKQKIAGLLRALPGILLSIGLLSLGAPFWYEALKNLLKLRSPLAQKEEQERQQRAAVQPAIGATPAALPTEAGDLNVGAIASRPGTEG
jgi:hypothetical protein